MFYCTAIALSLWLIVFLLRGRILYPFADQMQLKVKIKPEVHR